MKQLTRWRISPPIWLVFALRFFQQNVQSFDRQMIYQCNAWLQSTSIWWTLPSMPVIFENQSSSDGGGIWVIISWPGMHIHQVEATSIRAIADNEPNRKVRLGLATFDILVQKNVAVLIGCAILHVWSTLWSDASNMQSHARIHDLLFLEAWRMWDLACWK